MCGPHHCLGRDAFASGPEILRRLLQLRQNASIIGQGCAGHSPNSANRKHQITRHPWRTSPPLRPSLSFRYTQAGIPMSTHLYPEVAAHVMRVTETAHWLEWQDWADPVLQTPYVIRDGLLHVPDVPGVGLEWNEDAVAANRANL